MLWTGTYWHTGTEWSRRSRQQLNWDSRRRVELPVATAETGKQRQHPTLKTVVNVEKEELRAYISTGATNALMNGFKRDNQATFRSYPPQENRLAASDLTLSATKRSTLGKWSLALTQQQADQERLPRDRVVYPHVVLISVLEYLLLVHFQFDFLLFLFVLILQKKQPNVSITNSLRIPVWLGHMVHNCYLLLVFFLGLLVRFLFLWVFRRLRSCFVPFFRLLLFSVFSLLALFVFLWLLKTWTKNFFRISDSTSSLLQVILSTHRHQTWDFSCVCFATRCSFHRYLFFARFRCFNFLRLFLLFVLSLLYSHCSVIHPFLEKPAQKKKPLCHLT